MSGLASSMCALAKQQGTSGMYTGRTTVDARAANSAMFSNSTRTACIFRKRVRALISGAGVVVYWKGLVGAAVLSSHRDCVAQEDFSARRAAAHLIHHTQRRHTWVVFLISVCVIGQLSSGYVNRISNLACTVAEHTAEEGCRARCPRYLQSG